MADTDYDIKIGALPDLASINKAGEQIRAALNKHIMGSLASIGVGGSTIKGFLQDASHAKTGLEVFSAYRHVQTELKEITKDINRMNRVLGLDGTKDTMVLTALRDSVNTAVNVTRRVAVNEPINKELAIRRAAQKEAELAANPGIKTSTSPIPGLFRGGDVSQAIYRNIYGKRLNESERTQAIVDATAAFGATSATPDKIASAIYKNVYSRDMTEDERERTKADALAVWKDNTKAIKALTKATTIVGTEVIRTAAAVIPTYWQEHVSRSYWGSREAQVARTGAIAKGAGGVVGAAIGGAIGSVVPGVGTVIGAGIGGALGESVGGLYGQYQSKQLEAVKRTIGQVNQRYRMAGMYGSQMSVGYAQSVADTDMASAGDVEKMVHNSATLGARMMFGQVGENEMMMYSLMPNYFAAAMNGASAEELAEIFKSDLDRLPPMLRTWAAESVGGGSLGMMAYANSPMFDIVQGNASTVRTYDEVQMRAGKGYAVASANRAFTNRAEEFEAFREDLGKSAKRGDPNEFVATGDEYESALLHNDMYEKAVRQYNDLTKNSRFVAHQVINIVLPDGSIAASEENDIIQEMDRGGYTPTYTTLVGGF